ncbi:DNA methyltransferase [Brevundimonas sp.]|uniref:DNA methyltransferase n=1 Tax=Brevundimonas sp. TaxID=1871086 RepID=UPI003567913E
MATGTGYLVKMVAIGTVVPYVRNPRKNTAAIAKVASSLREFGWRQPIVCDEALTVIAGHTRLEAARSLGMAEVPVHIAIGLTATQVKAYRLADNRVGAEAEWDNDLLALELAELKVDGFDLALTGFDADELTAMFNLQVGDIVETPEADAPAVAVTQIGDVWVMGGGRLVCGDSTDAGVVARAVDGRTVGALVFDPPFEDAALIERFDVAGYDADNVFVFGDCMYATARAINAGIPWRFGFIWDGVTRWIVPGRPLLAHKTCDWFSADGAYDYECVKDGRDGETKQQKGTNARGDYMLEADPRGKSLASVFRSPVTAEGHGAAHSKPVLWTAMLLGNCSAGLILDVFAGSGTTLLAAHQIRRQWAGVELSPAYCDVIVDRWQLLTGETAVHYPAQMGAAAP